MANISFDSFSRKDDFNLVENFPLYSAPKRMQIPSQGATESKLDGFAFAFQRKAETPHRQPTDFPSLPEAPASLASGRSKTGNARSLAYLQDPPTRFTLPPKIFRFNPATRV